MLANEDTLAQRDVWPDFLLFLAAVILLFCGLGTGGLWGSEGRWAEVVREMFLTRDFFHPTNNGEPYFDKPLLTYWFIAVITAITGMLNEWVVRIPSAVSGLVVIGAMRWIGGRLWSARTSRLAAWILLSTYGFVLWGRTAAADMENLAAIILALAWYCSRKDHPDFRSFLVFYLILSLGSLCKGLTAAVVPLMVILPDLIMKKRWRMLLKPAHVLALILGGIVFLAPFLYASVTNPEYHSSGLSLVFKENIIRYFKPFDHIEPFYLYLHKLPFLLLPWSILFAAALANSVKSWKALDYNTRWLLTSVILVFMFFTLSGSRRSYYILPTLPLCALLMAVFLNYVRDGESTALRRWGIGIQGGAVFIIVAANLLLPVGLLIVKATTGFAAPAIAYWSGISIGLAGLILGRWAYKSAWVQRCFQVQPLVGAMIVIAVVTMGGYFCWQHNLCDRMRTERPMLLELKNKVAGLPPDRIGIILKRGANVCFYLEPRGHVRIIQDIQTLEQFLEDDRPGVLIVAQQYVAGIPPNIMTDLDRMSKLVQKRDPWQSESETRNNLVAWILNPPTTEVRY